MIFLAYKKQKNHINPKNRTQFLILPRIFNKKSLTLLSVKSTFWIVNDQKSYSHIVHKF